MLFVISPAKSLNLSAETRYPADHTEPRHLDATQELVGCFSSWKRPN